jgi:hypothetical protein
MMSMALQIFIHILIDYLIENESMKVMVVQHHLHRKNGRDI